MIVDKQIDALKGWLAQAGLAGTTEHEIISGFCERVVAAGVPVSRAQVFIDTLHPVHEGRLFRWGHDPSQPPVYEYGRTTSAAGQTGDGSAGTDPASDPGERWRKSPFFHMLQTGDDLLRRRLSAESEAEFNVLPDMRAAGITEYVAIINRFAPENVIGDMDCVYSSWMTGLPDGFSDGEVATLKKVVPFLALAIKTVALARMTATLMETYLGRDAGQRVLSGKIVRGLADRIDAVIWFSDLRGFTRITDTAPEQVIPLLNDYADVIVTAIHGEGGDVLKLIGDGTFAIFVADDMARACHCAIAAAIAARRGVVQLKEQRAAAGLAVTDMYLGLHVGQVFYGNIGSTERLDFTVVGPAVNEASRIAAMCRSTEQPILLSAAFAQAGGINDRIISVGRYALRGVSKPQELFTLDPAEWG
jgi:adenylate cyclase